MTDAERPLVSRLFPRVGRTDAGASSASGGSLPADMEEAAAHRLGALALVVSVVASILGTAAQFAGGQAALGTGVRLSFIVADVLVSFLLYLAIARRWL